MIIHKSKTPQYLYAGVPGMILCGADKNYKGNSHTKGYTARVNSRTKWDKVNCPQCLALRKKRA
jgi:hypothetical protein